MPSTDAAALGLFVGRGYRHARSFWHMQRGLPAADTPVDDPDGITMRLGAPEGDELIAYHVLDEAFRDNFGYEPSEQEEWLQEFRGMPGYDPSLIVLAFEGDEPVGVSVSMAADDGVGWVGDLGVRDLGGAGAWAGRCSPGRSRSSPRAGTTRCALAWTPRTRRARPTCTRESA